MIAYINHIPRIIFEQGVIHSGRSRASYPKFTVMYEKFSTEITFVSVHY